MYTNLYVYKHYPKYMSGVTEHQLRIERMTDNVLLACHMHYINECMKYDLWKDITDTFAYQAREEYGREIRIRMDAE